MAEEWFLFDKFTNGSSCPANTALGVEEMPRSYGMDSPERGLREVIEGYDMRANEEYLDIVDPKYESAIPESVAKECWLGAIEDHREAYNVKKAEKVARKLGWV